MAHRDIQRPGCAIRDTGGGVKSYVVQLVDQSSEAAIMTFDRFCRRAMVSYMTSRKWYKLRTVAAQNQIGAEISLCTGIMKDESGRPIAVLAVEDGPTAVLKSGYDGGVEAQLRLNIVQTIEDFNELRERLRIPEEYR